MAINFRSIHVKKQKQQHLMDGENEMCSKFLILTLHTKSLFVFGVFCPVNIFFFVEGGGNVKEQCGRDKKNSLIFWCVSDQSFLLILNGL